MAPYRFAVGQTVEIVHHRFDGNVPHGTYTVLRQLPGPQNDREYRVKHVRDGHERMVLESQLRGFPAPSPG
jgi:hypothetical protein